VEIKNVPIGAVKAGPDDGLEEGEFLVYPSTFTRTPTRTATSSRKGAFLDDIADWKASGNVLPGLYGHRMDDPDYFVAGAVRHGRGRPRLVGQGEVRPRVPVARRVRRSTASSRAAASTSCRSPTTRRTRARSSSRTAREANELRKLKVYEFSFVPVGANQDTSVVAVKS
jgi:hypothetical protein